MQHSVVSPYYFMPLSFSSPDGFFIKSIRFNNFCFIDQLIDGLTLTPDQKRPVSPRIQDHKPYTVLASGVHLRKNKPQRYSTEELEKKTWLSPHQSVSLILKDQVELPVVNVNVGKYSDALAGIIIDPKDALCNRYFLYDSNTYFRPYEFNTELEALAYYKENKNNILFANFEEFKQALIQNKNARKQNEILARIRWNSDSSVGIFNDNEESHFVAQIYAAKIKKALKSKAERVHMNWWYHLYEVPIYYYIPGNPKNYQVYPLKQIQDDRKKANDRLHNVSDREQSFTIEHFACLLLADDPQFALNIQWKNEPIILALIRLGLFHIAQGMVENAGYAQIVDYLIQKKLLLNVQKICTWNCQVIQQVISFNRNDLFDMIMPIADHSTINDTNENGETPLMLAALKGHIEMVIKLLFAKAKIDIKKSNGDTALILGSSYRPVVALLTFIQTLQANNQLSNCELNEAILLNLVIEKNEAEVLELLIKNNPSLLNKGLLIAIEKKNTVLALNLLKHGADVNATNEDSNTALILAAVNGQQEIVHTLLRAKANVNYRNKNNDTALLLAVFNGQACIVDKLLAAGAIVNETNKEHCTSLMLAAFKGDIDMVIKLLFAKTDIDIKKSNGDTVLTMASPHRPVVALLTFIHALKANNQLIYPDLNETTLLNLALEKNENEVIQILIKNNPTLLNTVLQSAIEGKNFGIFYSLFNLYKKIAPYNTSFLSQNIISWNNFLSIFDESKWENKGLFTCLLDLQLISTHMPLEFCDLIKKHALACFNYLNSSPKDKRAISLRKIFLNRILFEKFTDKREIEDEIKAYLRGNSIYSQSCWGGCSSGKESRIAYAYNMIFFPSPRTSKFEDLSQKERKHIIKDLSVLI